MSRVHLGQRLFISTQHQSYPGGLLPEPGSREPGLSQQAVTGKQGQSHLEGMWKDVMATPLTSSLHTA